MGRGRRPKKRPPVSSSESEDEDDDGDLMLPVGAEVEVRSDDPGFVGSFYEATVAGHLLSSGGRGCYTVAYFTLEGEDGEPLRETADAADVRPRPPPPEERRGFAVYEMVEAFHNEGWWAGVVSVVVPPPPGQAGGDCGPRVYKVTFPTSRELLEFEETALRPHRVFEDGRWAPAAEVDNGSPLFNEGIQVEVSQSAKRFGESWNPATISKVIGPAVFQVQYNQTREDGDFATEILDSQYIRPARKSTYMDSKYRFSPSSHVEVFHEGSWWPGVVLEVLGSEINKKYVIKLKNHRTDMEDVDVLTVENTLLRPQYDWVGKKWVRCLKKKPANAPPLTGRKRSISGALSLHNDGGEISNKPDSHHNKKFKNAEASSKLISPPPTVCNENDEVDHQSSSYPEETVEQGKAVLASGSRLSLPSLPFMPGFGHLSSSSVAHSSHLEQSSSQIIIVPAMPQSPQLQASLFGAFGQPRPVPQGPRLGTRSFNPDFCCIKGSEKVLSEQKNINVGTEIEHPETPKKGISAKTIEEASNTVAIYEDLAEELPNDVIAGCGIPSEMNMDIYIDLTPREDIRGSQEDINEDNQENVVGLPCNGHPTQNASITIDSPFSLTSLGALKGDIVIAESPTMKLAPNEQYTVSRQGRTSAMVECAAESNQPVERSTVTLLSSVGTSNSTETESDNSLAITNSVVGSPFSNYVASRTHDSCCPSSLESVDPHESMDMNGQLSESLAIQHLPFVKTSPTWAQIEALEIFSKVPQRPNFRQFEQYGPELAEGMALGLMFSFAILAESIYKLDVQDDQGLLEEKMKGLSSLEANGFDVRDLRSRIETLLHTKNSCAQLQHAMKKLEEIITNKETDDRELGTQIRMLATAVHHLELQAYLMRGIMRSATSQKMNNAMEISRLRTEANELERSYLSLAMPWGV